MGMGRRVGAVAAAGLCVVVASGCGSTGASNAGAKPAPTVFTSTTAPTVAATPTASASASTTASASASAPGGAGAASIPGVPPGCSAILQALSGAAQVEVKAAQAKPGDVKAIVNAYLGQLNAAAASSTPAVKAALRTYATALGTAVTAYQNGRTPDVGPLTSAGEQLGTACA